MNKDIFKEIELLRSKDRECSHDPCNTLISFNIPKTGSECFSI
jgi:hypothetical protein